MVSQLRTFAAEVTRVALEVGTEGILGGQATVEGVQGVWADLTTNVNVGLFLCGMNSISQSWHQTEHGAQSYQSGSIHC
jgi:hypothetical protein